jgi:hypothetical protein
MPKSDTSDTVLKDAFDRFEESDDASQENRTNAEDDIRFSRLAEQWPERIQKDRRNENRPCLTINRLPAFIRQVVNDARRNKPSIRVGPVDNGADVETAEVIGGLIRAIERASEAEIAYDTAIDHSVTGGFGFFRITSDYCHADSFDLEARIERIPNPLMVHWDTSSKKFDASDWEYAFVSDLLSHDQFEKMYPDAEKVSFEGDDRETLSAWSDGETIRIAEYWLRTARKRTLIQLSDGRAIRLDDVPGLARAQLAAMGVEIGAAKDEELTAFYMQSSGLTETRRRETDHYEVVRRIITGAEILEEETWPGSTIPICPVWGDEVFLDGKRHFRSLIRDARDPQAMFNFWRSATTELVALAPRSPWVGPKGFIPDGDEERWRTANTRSHAYLEYEGNVAPTRTPFAGVPAGALQEALNAADDMKAIIGIYDAALGARSNETSGKAIMARQRESDIGTFHFIDNLSRAIRYAGRILVEIIPALYSTRTVIRTLGEDMKEKVISLAGGEGSGKIYDLSVGKYDVTVKTGPSYSTQREETRETLIEIMRQVPDSAAVLGDVLMEHMDFPGAATVAKRLKTLLPPAVQQAEAAETVKGLPPEAQALAQQADQAIKSLQQQVQQLQNAPELKRLEIEKAKADSDRDIGLRRIKLEERRAALEEAKVRFKNEMDAVDIVRGAMSGSA